MKLRSVMKRIENIGTQLTLWWMYLWSVLKDPPDIPHGLSNIINLSVFKAVGYYTTVGYLDNQDQCVDYIPDFGFGTS